MWGSPTKQFYCVKIFYIAFLRIHFFNFSQNSQNGVNRCINSKSSSFSHNHCCVPKIGFSADISIDIFIDISIDSFIDILIDIFIDISIDILLAFVFYWHFYWHLYWHFDWQRGGRRREGVKEWRSEGVKEWRSEGVDLFLKSNNPTPEGGE